MADIDWVRLIVAAVIILIMAAGLRETTSSDAQTSGYRSTADSERHLELHR